MIENIIVIGAGQAGAQAVDTLRREGFKGRLILVGDEAQLPYQRPPLSKKFLADEMTEDRLVFRHQAFYDEHRIELHLSTAVTGIDPATKTVTCTRAVSIGESSIRESLKYDRLLLCLGATSRLLTCPGAQLAGIHYLRNLADASSIRKHIKPGARAVIIGGGYIGLETAATFRKMGCEITVLEMADRVMNRVAAPCVSQYFADSHASHGVKIICNSRVVQIEGLNQVERVLCADGSIHDADFVIVGVGAMAASSLANAAGLNCDNGIVVDEFCRTSDPNIYAAGDCTNHPSLHYARRIRLESVDNAVEQAKTAALNMLGREVKHDRVPWFWSDQFDNKLLIAGLSEGYDQLILRGDPAQHVFSVCYLKERALIAIEAVNQPKDYMAARRLIADRTPLNAAKIPDTHILLKEAI